MPERISSISSNSPIEPDGFGAGGSRSGRDSWLLLLMSESATGATQPSGVVTSIIVPHLGHDRICPTADALVTFSRAAHDVQTIENGSTD